MTDTDSLIKEQMIPFRERILRIVQEKHPYVYSIANSFFSGRKNMAGLQVTQDGQVVGEYTFHLDGLHIESVDTGKLDSAVNHPFLGIIKPYGVIEKHVIEKIIADEGFASDLIASFIKYLPDITIKFLR